MRETADAASFFAINAARIPKSFVDVDVHNLVQLDLEDLGPGTGWGNVPAPMF